MRFNYWAPLIVVLGALSLSGCDNELLGRIDKLEADASLNAEAGRVFLAENARRQGVVTTATGLQYRIIREGSGTRPQLTDRVRAHYRGTLIDGTPFDSSYDRGEPAVFPVNRLIPGWTEALQLMPAGSHWELFVPAELAYGKRSPSPKIPSNSALVFELELLQVLPNGG
ncbi:FKBP-type peptidyl-prolyl cis-trans isomerase [Motiliproteus sediminis]|uniref:FKBP-type peptidyl-prolyl cis-trans isomerase n=1 Tax=Motiliproteus sediminis TaxID=1468178 RepID=UPI001AF00EE0